MILANIEGTDWTSEPYMCRMNLAERCGRMRKCSAKGRDQMGGVEGGSYLFFVESNALINLPVSAPCEESHFR